MLLELRSGVLRVRNACRRPRGALQRLCRVRVLFPDIGVVPVVFDLAIERFSPGEPVRVFPSPLEVFHHLEGLTTP